MKSLNRFIFEQYSEKDLVKFGNFVLSKERQENIESDKSVVYDSDLANWKYKNKIENMKTLFETINESKEEKVINESAITDFMATLSKQDLEFIAGMLIGGLSIGGSLTIGAVKKALKNSKVSKEKAKELDELISEHFTE